jgi:hypothetical protein
LTSDGKREELKVDPFPIMFLSCSMVLSKPVCSFDLINNILNKKAVFSFVAKVIKSLHAEYRIQGVERNAGYPSVDKVRRKTCLNENRRLPGFKADIEDFWSSA